MIRKFQLYVPLWKSLVIDSGSTQGRNFCGKNTVAAARLTHFSLAGRAGRLANGGRQGRGAKIGHHVNGDTATDTTALPLLDLLHYISQRSPKRTRKDAAAAARVAAATAKRSVLVDLVPRCGIEQAPGLWAPSLLSKTKQNLIFCECILSHRANRCHRLCR